MWSQSLSNTGWECDRSTSSFSQADFGTDHANISFRAATVATSYVRLANYIHLYFFQEIPLSLSLSLARTDRRSPWFQICRQCLGRGDRVITQCCLCADCHSQCCLCADCHSQCCLCAVIRHVATSRKESCSDRPTDPTMRMRLVDSSSTVFNG
jgi:hypothetical protein